MGTSALGKLLDFAVDRYYEEPEEEELNCFPVLTATASADAEDYTRLLELTTLVDNPHAEVTTFDFSGCDDWTHSEEATALVNQALWEATYIWSWGESSYFREVAAPGVGGNEFKSLLETSLVVIEEHTALVHEDGSVTIVHQLQNC